MIIKSGQMLDVTTHKDGGLILVLPISKYNIRPFIYFIPKYRSNEILESKILYKDDPSFIKQIKINAWLLI